MHNLCLFVQFVFDLFKVLYFVDVKFISNFSVFRILCVSLHVFCSRVAGLAVYCLLGMNRRNIFIILLIALICAPLQRVKGSERAFVSLLTCSPGDEVYAFFGHTALRYCNPDKGLDWVFNYGVFDFSEPNFVGKFVSGETDYMLGIVEFPYFIQEYAMRGSAVVEQELAFDSLQRERLFALLRENYRPANRIYRYNYFYNNCTTKARDIIEAALGDGASIKYPENADRRDSFRRTVHRFTAVSPWYSFGIDLLLGCEADAQQDARTLQFIPSTLQADFSAASIVRGDSVVPLLARTETLIEAVPADSGAALWFTPTLFFVILLLAVVLVAVVERRMGRIFWGLDLLLMTAQGVAGVVVAYMLLFSQHPTVGSNLLIILLNPLPLLILPIYIYSIVKGRKPQILWLQAAMALLFIVSTPLLSQYIPMPLYVFAATLLIRTNFILLNNRK